LELRHPKSKLNLVFIPSTLKRQYIWTPAKTAKGNEFILDGAGASFIRVFNYKGHLIELKTRFPKSQIIYNFEKTWNYRIELNYFNGTVLKKDVLVLN
jgi:hypothetical protein